MNGKLRLRQHNRPLTTYFFVREVPASLVRVAQIRQEKWVSPAVGLLVEFPFVPTLGLSRKGKLCTKFNSFLCCRWMIVLKIKGKGTGLVMITRLEPLETKLF